MSDTTSQSAIGKRRAAARGSMNAPYGDRRAEIAAAAAELFKERGFRGTSLADIARRVNVDRASLYYYFSSKEDILDLVVSDVVKANLETAERILASSDSAPDKIRNLVVDLMISYADHYPVLYVYLQENFAHVVPKRQPWAQEMRAVNRRYEATIEQIVRDGIRAGEIKGIADPRVLAYGVIGMVSWTNRWFNPQRSDVDARTVGESYAEILLSGLEASPAS